MPVWIRGEVVGCKAWSSGHWYFSLRDRQTQVRCCMWSRYNQRNGRPARRTGPRCSSSRAPGIYEAKGEFQLDVTRMIPTAAIGAAQRELERVKEAAPARRAHSTRPGSGRFPSWSRTVAVVTSTDGAALRDIITVVGKRWPCCRLVVVNARVQGDGAVRALVRALRAGEPHPGRRAVHRGPGRRRHARIWPPSTAKRSAAPSRRSGCPPSPPWGTRPTSRSPISSPTCAPPTPSAAAEMAVADRREVLRLLDDLGAAARGRPRRVARGSARSGWPARPTGSRARSRACSGASATAPTGSAPSSTR